MSSWARRALGLSVSGLALFRIGLAAIVVVDLCLRFSEFRFFYLDSGFVPRSLSGLGPPTVWPSVYGLVGSYAAVMSLYLVHLVAAVGLGLGYRARWLTPVVWYLTLSLHQRNPFVLSMGDYLLQCYLFWAMFLPLDKRFVPGGEDEDGDREVFSLASVGLVFQICSVYFFSGLHKLLDPLWRNGEALELALRNKQYARFGDSLQALELPLEWPVIMAQILIGFFLLIPGRARWIGIGLSVSFHLATSLMFELGLFPFVGLVGMFVFLGASADGGPEFSLKWWTPVAFWATMIALIVNLDSLYTSPPRPQVLRMASSVSAVQNWKVFSGPVLGWETLCVPEVTDKRGRIYELPVSTAPRMRTYLHRLVEPRYQSLRLPACKHFGALASVEVQSVELWLTARDIETGQTTRVSLWVWKPEG